MSDLKDSLKKHFDSVELSNSELKRLQSMSPKKTWISLIKENLKVLIPTFAVTILAIVILIPRGDLKTQIMKEVVKNHVKNMPSEIVTADLTKIGGTLDRLDFSLIDSRWTSSLKLIGARYCSIKGVIAAQLSFKDDKNNRFTVYQVPLDEKLKNGEGLIGSSTIDGVEVKIYAEQGLLIGVASSKI